MKAVKDAIKFHTLDSISDDLSETEEQVIKALRDTVLGREGSIFLAMFSGEGRQAAEKLIKRGIVVHIKGHQNSFNQEFIGLAGELYPESNDEFNEYRTSGYSEKGSYSEFLDAQEAGEIKWDSKKISEFIDKDVQKLFKQKMKTKDFFINYCDDMIEAV